MFNTLGDNNIIPSCRTLAFPESLLLRLHVFPFLSGIDFSRLVTPLQPSIEPRCPNIDVVRLFHKFSDVMLRFDVARIPGLSA